MAFNEPFAIPIIRVVQLLGLPIAPNYSGGESMNVQCPFCDQPGKYHMNINLAKNVYSCPRCGTGKNTGALDLYGRVRLGQAHIPGKNGNGKELFATLRAELGETDTWLSDRQNPSPNMGCVDVLPADDRDLHAAYSALLELKPLALSYKHFAKLESRGLDQETIRNSSYRSLRHASEFLKHCDRADSAMVWAKQPSIKTEVEKLKKLRSSSDEEIAAGRAIASMILENHPGLSLKGVPGFFLLGGEWAFVYTSGMIIPTVSLDGHIVGLQIRRDTATESGLRYVTVSSKGLEAGPTTNIARTHVARTDTIGPNTTVLITEGPLKADVILHLLKERGKTDLAVIAIQGVNNIKELPEIRDKLLQCGVTRIFGAFDMDKLVNMSVATAEVKIAKLFQHGNAEAEEDDDKQTQIKYLQLFWDHSGACKRRIELAEIAENYGIDLREPTFGASDIYDCVFRIARALYLAHVDYNYVEIDGNRVKRPWDPNTKGLDDWLNSTRITLKGGKSAAL